MRPLKDNVSVSLDIDVIEKVKQFSEEDERSFSQYVNIVLKEHIAQKEHAAKKNAD